MKLRRRNHKLKLPLLKIILGCLCVLCSCGYRLEDDESFEDKVTTINIPYAKGDVQGILTNELIRQISSSGYFVYVREGGALTLNVNIISDMTSKIGWRFDRNEKTCKRTNHLQPTEARRYITAEISLFDEGSLTEIIKPTLVNAFFDYDFIGTHSLCDLSFIDQHGHRQTVTAFSLGQLDSVEGATDDVAVPLYRLLAQKIVNGLILQRL